MKKILAIFLVLSFIAVPAFAAKGRKGASDTAYKNANEQAVFHRAGDWFATVGKTEKEKKAIVAERKAKRATLKVQKEAEKKKKMLQKEIERQQKQAEKQRQKTLKKLNK